MQLNSNYLLLFSLSTTHNATSQGRFPAYRIVPFELVKRDAFLGKDYAEFEMGRRYEFGDGGAELDFTKATFWYRKGAEKGNALALTNYGGCLRYGRGTDKNIALAAEMIQKAADLGHAFAQLRLGFYYRDGAGVEADPGQQHYWTREAAEQGFTQAQTELAIQYHWGIGTEKSPVRIDAYVCVCVCVCVCLCLYWQQLNVAFVGRCSQVVQAGGRQWQPHGDVSHSALLRDGERCVARLPTGGPLLSVCQLPLSLIGSNRNR